MFLGLPCKQPQYPTPRFFGRHGLWSALQRYQFLAVAVPAAAAVPWCWLDQRPVCAHRVTEPENEGEAEYQLDMSGQRFLAAREADGPASRQLLPVMPARRRTDADGRWKDALDVYFQPCLQLFWPSLHALIDWRQPPQFLDKELQALTLSKGRNRRYVDKLASVQLLQGERICLLVHMGKSRLACRPVSPAACLSTLCVCAKHTRTSLLCNWLSSRAAGQIKTGWPIVMSH